MGFLIQNTHDYITLNKNGIFVTSLGAEPKKYLVDNNGVDRVCHSLDSFNYIKIDQDNFLEYQCAKNEYHVVSI